MIYVKNTTDGTTLVLTTDYTIASDRRSITVSGEDAGDTIEIKYNRYWECSISGLAEQWLSGDPDGDRYRDVELELETLSQTSVV